jgi:hypothetical protein
VETCARLVLAPGKDPTAHSIRRQGARPAGGKPLQPGELGPVQELWKGPRIAFLATNVCLGGESCGWVRHCETGGGVSSSLHPPGFDGCLPIAGLMNLNCCILTGRIPSIHPAELFLPLTFVAISFLCRESFSVWLCSAGTFSEDLGRRGPKIFRRSHPIPRCLDFPPRGCKYLLLGFLPGAVAGMSAPLRWPCYLETL